MATPFDPQPLTAEQLQEIEDRQLGDNLIKLTNQVIDKVTASEDTLATKLRAYFKAWNSYVFSKQPFPSEINIGDLATLAPEYRKTFDLHNELANFLGGVSGWRGGVGQPKQETFDQLKARLAGLYPDAAAVVK